MYMFPEVSYITNNIDIAFSQPQTQMQDTELIQLSILYSFDINKSQIYYNSGQIVLTVMVWLFSIFSLNYSTGRVISLAHSTLIVFCC